MLKMKISRKLSSFKSTGEQKKTIELAEQDRAIAIAEKSRAESEAKAQADKARAEAVKAEEEVVTVRETQRAERQKAVELVAAKQTAEKKQLPLPLLRMQVKKRLLMKPRQYELVQKPRLKKYV